MAGGRGVRPRCATAEAAVGQRGSTLAGQVAVVVIAGASLLGVGSLLSSADEGDGAEPATTTTTEDF